MAREFWTNLTLEEQNLLQDIVQNQPPVSKDKLLIRRLIKKGIIQQDEQSQQISFQAPLIQKYVEQELEL